MCVPGFSKDLCDLMMKTKFQEISTNQAKRRKKNSVRKERRHSRIFIEPSARTDGVNNAVDPVVDNNSSSELPTMHNTTYSTEIRHY